MLASFFAICLSMICNANINGEKKNMTHISFLSYFMSSMALLESVLCK